MSPAPPYTGSPVTPAWLARLQMPAPPNAAAEPPERTAQGTLRPICPVAEMPPTTMLPANSAVAGAA